MLRCADGSYHVGCTTALEQSYGQHLDGVYDGYTATRRPVVMVRAEEFQTLQDAIEAEQRIKRWTRVKKEALIDAEWDRLRVLARNRQHHPVPA